MRGQDLSPCIITLSFSLSLTKECLEFPAPHPIGKAHLTGNGWFPNSQSLLHSWRRLCFGLHILLFIIFLIDTFARVHPYKMLALEGFNNEDILHEGHFGAQVLMTGISPVLRTHTHTHSDGCNLTATTKSRLAQTVWEKCNNTYYFSFYKRFKIEYLLWSYNFYIRLKNRISILQEVIAFGIPSKSGKKGQIMQFIFPWSS